MIIDIKSYKNLNSFKKQGLYDHKSNNFETKIY